MWVIRAEIDKMLVRIANREDPYQTASKEQSDLGLHCVSWPTWLAASHQNFSTFTMTRNLLIIWLKVFWIVPVFRVLGPTYPYTFYRKSVLEYPVQDQF